MAKEIKQHGTNTALISKNILNIKEEYDDDDCINSKEKEVLKLKKGLRSDNIIQNEVFVDSIKPESSFQINNSTVNENVYVDQEMLNMENRVVKQEYENDNLDNKVFICETSYGIGNTKNDVMESKHYVKEKIELCEISKVDNIRTELISSEVGNRVINEVKIDNEIITANIKTEFITEQLCKYICIMYLLVLL